MPRDCCCPLGYQDPACYCGCRPLCEGFVNTCLLPFLGSGCGKCLINNVTGPAWRTCDVICMRDGRDSTRPSGVDAAIPVVTLTIRPVKDVAEYKTAYDKYAKAVQSSNPGVRAFFSFIDKSSESTVLQVCWYDR